MDKAENTRWHGDNVDSLSRKSGNCFLTKKEAEEEIKRKEVESLLKKYTNGYKWTYKKNNYFLYCYIDPIDGVCVRITDDYLSKSSETIHFETEIQAKEAIYEIGEDRILKDYFQIERSQYNV